jgi:cytoskeletal protein CcmA (bactofilin family)
MGARVVLHPSAEVEGDIHARTLSVADGASFEGRSRKVTDPATVAPRLEPGAPAHTGAPVPVPRAVPADLSN